MAKKSSKGGARSDKRDAAPGAGGGCIMSPKVSLEEAMDSRWPVAEMEEAIPCDVPEVSDEMIKAALEASKSPPRRAKSGETVAPAKPPADDDERVSEVEPMATLGGYNYPPPFTRFHVLSDCRLFPYRTIGKVFFKNNGKRYVCSAAAIGNYAIWTAGHCMHAGNNDPNSWSTDVTFVPAYYNGNMPYGQWPASRVAAKQSWYRNGIPLGLCQDMGGAVLFPTVDGKKISDVVGNLGFVANSSRYQHWNAPGYPAEFPFDGQSMVKSQASYAYDGFVGCTPNPVGIGCYLTRGASGGPWIVEFGTNYILNGNNSYRRVENGVPYADEMYSPYFGDEAASLYAELLAATP